MKDKAWTAFDQKMMERALAEARLAAASGEVPVAAVVTCQEKVIAQARNRKEEMKSALGHAELLALAAASQILGRWRLSDCEIYVTLEPCLMCAGALVHSRVSQLIFGVRDPKFGGVKSLFETVDDSRLNHQVRVSEGLLAEESREMLRAFFRERRKKSRVTCELHF